MTSFSEKKGPGHPMKCPGQCLMHFEPPWSPKAWLFLREKGLAIEGGKKPWTWKKNTAGSPKNHPIEKENYLPNLHDLRFKIFMTSRVNRLRFPSKKGELGLRYTTMPEASKFVEAIWGLSCFRKARKPRCSMYGLPAVTINLGQM